MSTIPQQIDDTKSCQQQIKESALKVESGLSATGQKFDDYVSVGSCSQDRPQQLTVQRLSAHEEGKLQNVSTNQMKLSSLCLTDITEQQGHTHEINIPNHYQKPTEASFQTNVVSSITTGNKNIEEYNFFHHEYRSIPVTMCSPHLTCDGIPSSINNNDQTSNTTPTGQTKIKKDSAQNSSGNDTDSNQFLSPEDQLVSSSPFPYLTLQQIMNMPRKIKKSKKVIMDFSETRYEVIKNIAQTVMNWTLVYQTPQNREDWYIAWYDNYIGEEELKRMLPYQKINHFPNSYYLGKKNFLGQNLGKLKRLCPEDYNFFPKTWVLPLQHDELKNYFQQTRGQKKYFISKPEASCQGRGIFLTKKFESFSHPDRCVVQEYIRNPYLIDGLKFDFRIYVLVKSVCPLKIFMYQEGLARFATQKYAKPSKKNQGNLMMHLTNYAVNKRNPNFIQNENEADDDKGHKRSFTSIMKYLFNQGVDISKVYSQMRQIIIKTIVSVQPHLAHIYKSCQPKEGHNELCFELFGFDIMLDEDLKLWLLEVNHQPSLCTDSPLDLQIKKHVILDTLNILNISYKQKKKFFENKAYLQLGLKQGAKYNQKVQLENYEEERKALAKKMFEDEEVHKGAYLRIFPAPVDDPVNYQKFLDASYQAWNEVAPASPQRKLTSSSRQSDSQSQGGQSIQTRYSNSTAATTTNNTTNNTTLTSNNNTTAASNSNNTATNNNSNNNVANISNQSPMIQQVANTGTTNGSLKSTINTQNNNGSTPVKVFAKHLQSIPSQQLALHREKYHRKKTLSVPPKTVSTTSASHLCLNDDEKSVDQNSMAGVIAFTGPTIVRTGTPRQLSSDLKMKAHKDAASNLQHNEFHNYNSNSNTNANGNVYLCNIGNAPSTINSSNVVKLYPQTFLQSTREHPSESLHSKRGIICCGNNNNRGGSDFRHQAVDDSAFVFKRMELARQERFYQQQQQQYMQLQNQLPQPTNHSQDDSQSQHQLDLSPFKQTKYENKKVNIINIDISSTLLLSQQINNVNNNGNILCNNNNNYSKYSASKQQQILLQQQHLIEYNKYPLIKRNLFNFSQRANNRDGITKSQSSSKQSATNANVEDNNISKLKDTFLLPSVIINGSILSQCLNDKSNNHEDTRGQQLILERLKTNKYPHYVDRRTKYYSNFFKKSGKDASTE